VLVIAAMLVAACGERDPGALGPTGIDGGVSQQSRKQDYLDGVQRALGQFAPTLGPDFARAAGAANRRQLQVVALRWDEGVATLKQLDPPADAVGAHKRLLAASEARAAWNARIIAAAPNKKRVLGLTRQAERGSDSKAFEDAICELVDLGYPVVEDDACSPLNEAGGPGGDVVGGP
jgi:hypothetical protein